VLSATEARAAGLLARVVADEALEQEVSTLAGALARSSPSAMALTKQLFYRLDGCPLAEGIALGARVNALARQTPDFRAAIGQFLRK
jgi:enoyl-CoA hydratase/carnithine racemase